MSRTKDADPLSRRAAPHSRAGDAPELRGKRAKVTASTPGDLDSPGGRLCRDGRGGTPRGDDPHDDDRARRGVALVEPERDDRTVAQAQAGSGPSPRSKRSPATRTAVRRMEPREAPGRCCCLTPIPVTAPARPVCSATGSAAVLKVGREPRPASVLPRCADPTVREPKGVNSAGLIGRAGGAHRRPVGGRCSRADTVAIDVWSFWRSSVRVRTSSGSQFFTNSANRLRPNSSRRRSSCDPAGVRLTRYERPSAGSAMTSTYPASSTSRTCRVTSDGWTCWSSAMSDGRICS